MFNFSFLLIACLDAIRDIILDLEGSGRHRALRPVPNLFLARRHPLHTHSMALNRSPITNLSPFSLSHFDHFKQWLGEVRFVIMNIQWRRAKNKFGEVLNYTTYDVTTSNE